jgi:hypothetical protein
MNAMGMADVGRLVGGRFRVDRELERGPGTQSLLVTDLRNGRPCVLRKLSPALAGPAAARRFEAQAVILARLDRTGLPHFVDGFTEGEGEDEERVVVTTYHPGENLERLVAKGRPLTESQAFVLLRRLVPVLEYLHSFEPPLVHRTISATGIILGPDGRPCLTDLDFAGADPELSAAGQTPPGPEELALAAPEVYMGGALPASDIYALGLAICRGMTGREPAPLVREGARMQLRAALGVSEAFAAVIARMLDVSLERRYPDVKALDVDLARLAGEPVGPAQQPQVRGEEPREPRRARPLLLAGVALALVALAAIALRPRSHPAPEPSLVVTPAPQEQASAAAPVAEYVPEAATPKAQGPSLEPVPALAPPAPAQPAPPEAVPAAVEMRLQLDGKPYAGTDGQNPRVWLRNEGTKEVEQPTVDRAGDVYAIRKLAPGRYGMSVRIDLNAANPSRYPGDLDAWSQFTVAAESPVSIAVPLRRIIRLLQPADTNAILPGWEAPCGSGSVHPGKIVFAWEPLPVAASYHARVERLACGGGNASEGTVFSRTTDDAWVKVDLPPSAEGEYYSFSLTASAGEVPVGIMTAHGASGVGWNYRFTVAGGR